MVCHLCGTQLLLHLPSLSEISLCSCIEVASFAWKPRLADAVQSWNLPRTVSQPLKHLSNAAKGPALIDLAAAHGEEEEQRILQYPDLQVNAAVGTFMAE